MVVEEVGEKGGNGDFGSRYGSGGGSRYGDTLEVGYGNGGGGGGGGAEFWFWI